MINIRTDLIDKDLSRDRERGYEYHYKKLSNRYLDWLFRHYYIFEMTEWFYDSEPDIEDELLNMYLDYGYTSHKRIYSEYPHTHEELKDAYMTVCQIYEDYEQDRLEFNNWIEVNGEGIWGWSQKDVDEYGKRILKRIKKFPTSIKDRLFVAESDDDIRIYFYGRDLWKVDYWFIFKRK